MIKCKEDLFNRYIENVPGELRDLLFDKCNEFGIGISLSGLDSGYLEVYSCDSGEIDPYELVDCGCLEVDSKRLTLSDFKPARTEYVQVTESIFDLRDEFERGELSFQDSEGDWVSVVNESELVYFFDKDEIYRRVEKVVDWREEVREFLKKPSVDGELSIDKNYITIDCTFSESELLELCRVALRANGEIE